ncbi:MAG: asparagine synthase C-terminal domain-containing protein, partial [Acidobacteriaceae bacterium]|nr:asparagine synthase C-terminal domain-containing protein [Acidobacteriaceae bacterium]
SSYIGEVVRQYGTEHEQLDLNPEQDLESAIRELAYYSDEPSADSGALPVWFLSRLCKQHCTVVLSGEGADEIFGGYLTYRANLIAARLRRLPAGMIRLALRAMSAWPASNEKISLEYKIKRMLEGSLLPAERAHVYWNGTFSEDEKKSLVKTPLPGSLLDILSALRATLPGDGIAPYLEFDQQYYLADDILVKSDRISMAHSVEVRPPFLDHRILEFAASVPSELKIRGDYQKRVLKELMKPRLKAPITQRKKVGFDIPAHEWFRGPLRALLTETLEWARAAHGGLFDFGEIDRLTKLHMSRSVNVGYHLWGLMTLFLWMKQWNVQSAPVSQLSKEALLVGR